MLALAAGDGSPTTTRTIAETMKVPQSYLSKVLQSLVRARLVFSTRGLKGGFVLVKKPAEISMLDILNAVNPIQRIQSCPLDMNNKISDLCPLHRRLDHAMGLVEDAFSSTNLEELLTEKNPCPTLQEQLEVFKRMSET